MSPSTCFRLSSWSPVRWGMPDRWGALAGASSKWGLAQLGFCLALRVTSGVAFLPLFSQVSGYLCSVTLGASQAPSTANLPAGTLTLCQPSADRKPPSHSLWDAQGRHRPPPASPGSRLEDSASPLASCVSPPAHTSFRAVRVEWQFLLSEA